jgi:hypothetical protein
MRLGCDTTIRLGEQARLKIDRFLVDAGGEMTPGRCCLLAPPDHKHPSLRQLVE